MRLILEPIAKGRLGMRGAGIMRSVWDPKRENVETLKDDPNVNLLLLSYVALQSSNSMIPRGSTVEAENR